MKKLLVLTPLLLSLIACNTMTPEIEKSYQDMSCLELANKIGRYEGQLERAKIDGDIAIIGIIADDDMAVIDSMASDIDYDEAIKYLEKLRKLNRHKGC